MGPTDDSARKVAEAISDAINAFHGVVVAGAAAPAQQELEAILDALLGACMLLLQGGVRSSFLPSDDLIAAIELLQDWNRHDANRGHVACSRLMAPILIALAHPGPRGR